MATDNIEILLVKSWPVDEIVELYKAGGWWKESYNKALINSMIAGSFAFTVVVDKSIKKAVGMGRVISDGISDAYIQDLVILDDYRGQGLGKKLVNFLVNHCLSEGIKWIGLISEPGQETFYSNLGFSQMKNYVPMKFNIDD